MGTLIGALIIGFQQRPQPARRQLPLPDDRQGQRASLRRDDRQHKPNRHRQRHDKANETMKAQHPARRRHHAQCWAPPRPPRSTPGDGGLHPQQPLRDHERRGRQGQGAGLRPGGYWDSQNDPPRSLQRGRFTVRKVGAIPINPTDSGKPWANAIRLANKASNPGVDPGMRRRRRVRSGPHCLRQRLVASWLATSSPRSPAVKR